MICDYIYYKSDLFCICVKIMFNYLRPNKINLNYQSVKYLLKCIFHSFSIKITDICPLQKTEKHYHSICVQINI